MQLSRLRVLGCAVLPFLLSVSLAQAEDSPDLPPPPAESDMQSDLQNLSSSEPAEVGADLPPPPGALDEPSQTADATMASPPIDQPAAEELPALTEAPADALVPEDHGLSDVPPVSTTQQRYDQPAAFSSGREITDLDIPDRINEKELVLWLYLGPSYASLDMKGSYLVGAKHLTDTRSASLTGKSGGLGYAGGIGFMLGSVMQAQLDFIGVPRTTSSTVDQAMFGLGPRFGFFSAMALVGVQRGFNLTPTRNPSTGAVTEVPGGTAAIMAIGAKATVDIILGHAKDSRVSYGISPEAFYVTAQGADGYTNMGAAVSFRIFGYDNAF